MKKIIGLLSIMFCLALSANAQKVSADKVPAVVKSSFAKLHPGIKAKWEKEGKNYEVGFILNDRETTEVYELSGKLVETEMSVKFSELPLAVQLKLKGMKISETAKITKADGSSVYEAEVQGKDLLFDAKGNIVKL